MGISPQGLCLETWKGIHLPWTVSEGKRALRKQSISLYGGFVRGTWQEGSFFGNCESYVHVKEGSGNGATLLREVP